MLGYVIEHFEKYIKESDLQETMLDDNPVPENMGSPKAIDDYLKEMLLQANKSRELDKTEPWRKSNKRFQTSWDHSPNYGL